MVKIQKKNKKDDKIKQQRTRKTLAEKLEIIQLRENGAKVVKIACDKGQLISKGLVGILNSSKKTSKNLTYITILPLYDFFIVFWRD